MCDTVLYSRLNIDLAAIPIFFGKAHINGKFNVIIILTLFFWDQFQCRIALFTFKKNDPNTNLFFFQTQLNLYLNLSLSHFFLLLQSIFEN